MTEPEMTMAELLVAYNALEAKHAALQAAQVGDRLMLGEFNGNPTVNIQPVGKRPWTMGVTKFLVLVEKAEEWYQLYANALDRAKAN